MRYVAETLSVGELNVATETLETHNSIIFSMAQLQIPNMEAGDINFVIQEKEHELFKRKGADLLITKELTLNQALCGFSVSQMRDRHTV